jgi:hypothetical protein
MNRTLTTLGTSAGAAWTWWTGELRDMLPRQWAGGIRAKSDIRLSPDAVVVERSVGDRGERFVDQTPVDRFDNQNWAELAALVRDTDVRVVLQPPDVHLLSIRLPTAARTRLRSAVALQLIERSPLEPELVQWALGRPDVQAETITARVMLCRAQHLDHVQTLFAENEINLRAIAGQVCNEITELRKCSANDNLGFLRELSLGKRIAAGLLASIPLSVVIGATLLASLNASRVEALENEVQPKLAVERTLRQKEDLRRALAPVVGLPSISMLLDDLAGRLPSSAYLKEVERDNDGRMRLRVVARDPDAAQAALKRDPLLPGLHQTGQTPSEREGVDLIYEAGQS